MKQSETLTPCRFDDKDIMVDYDLWDWFLGQSYYISFCTGSNSFKCLFFLPCVEGDRAYMAHITYWEWNKIEVTCLQDNGTIWADDVKKLQELFQSWNNENDNDIYVQCEPTQEQDGRYVALTFKFYHTSPDLV